MSPSLIWAQLLVSVFTRLALPPSCTIDTRSKLKTWKKEKNNNLFFGIIDDSKPYCTVGISRDGISVKREGKEEIIGNNLVGDIYDDQFHKIQVFFDKTNVVLLLDCIQIARIPFAPLSG